MKAAISLPTKLGQERGWRFYSLTPNERGDSMTCGHITKWYGNSATYWQYEGYDFVFRGSIKPRSVSKHSEGQLTILAIPKYLLLGVGIAARIVVRLGGEIPEIYSNRFPKIIAFVSGTT